MVVHNTEPYGIGYNAICEIDKSHEDMFMDVGVIKLNIADTYTNDAALERAILLIEGSVMFSWEGQTQSVERISCFDDNPICLHLPQGVSVTVTGKTDGTELMYQAIGNEQDFSPKLYLADDTVTDIFGKDTLGNTSIRSVRTVIDDDIAPYSNLVIGEVINHPGKWSSYPPHAHVQPEVYHYRFLPDTGFGVSIIGEETVKVTHKSTSMIHTGVVHPQCSAPGYAMYYIWMIPHKPKRWLKDREFDEKHTWMLEEDAKIWPYK